MRQSLVDAPPGHHVAAQEQSDEDRAHLVPAAGHGRQPAGSARNVARPTAPTAAATAKTALAAVGWIARDALCVVEVSAKEPFAPPAGFAILDERRYGKARLVFVRYGGGGDFSGRNA